MEFTQPSSAGWFCGMCAPFIHQLEDVYNRTFHRAESLGNRNAVPYELTSLEPPPPLENPSLSLHNLHEPGEELQKLTPQHAFSVPQSNAVENVKLKILSDSYSIVEEEEICPTCLDGYDEENPMIKTACGHHFHLGCMLEWAERGKSTCPVCETEMVFDP